MVKTQSEEFQQNNLLKSCIGSLVKSENCHRTASPPDLAHCAPPPPHVMTSFMNSPLSHKKRSCTSRQRNIPPMQFLDCLIRSPRMPRKKLSYSPHQKNIPSMLEFLQYPFKRFFVHLTKNLLMHIEMHRLPHPNSSIT